MQQFFHQRYPGPPPGFWDFHPENDPKNIEGEHLLYIYDEFIDIFGVGIEPPGFSF